jgi:hypothetical protein
MVKKMHVNFMQSSLSSFKIRKFVLVLDAVVLLLMLTGDEHSPGPSLLSEVAISGLVAITTPSSARGESILVFFDLSTTA